MDSNFSSYFSNLHSVLKEETRVSIIRTNFFISFLLSFHGSVQRSAHFDLVLCYMLGLDFDFLLVFYKNDCVCNSFFSQRLSVVFHASERCSSVYSFYLHSIFPSYVPKTLENIHFYITNLNF